ncbi:hypothetical protein PGT21_006767 [Puccinia graminis f. sp. tritici]|uniref:Uncharacterized protein n=1 Tax=Puccinia graminis f. sp. tritici TaxID=56615 RepID=A0A5B0QER7_PUCGR|nr:hypothetical protein PGT21_006767 [Puccinia graminis f. sp. tritici]
MGSSNHHHHHHPGSGSLAGNPHGSSHPSTPTSSNPLVPAADPDPSNCQPSHLLPSEDCLLPSTPISSHHQAFVSSPSISLSLSSLSSTKPIHHSGANSGSTSSSTCSSTCSSPPSYKVLHPPPFSTLKPPDTDGRTTPLPSDQMPSTPLPQVANSLGFVLRQPRIPFLVNLASSPPSPAPPAQDHSLQVGRSKDKIPSIVHYVFGMAPDFGGKVIIRLEALRDYGGIYLDLDVFVVRNFRQPAEPGSRSGPGKPDPGRTFSRRPGSESVDEPVGLCNAIHPRQALCATSSPAGCPPIAPFNHHRWADHFFPSFLGPSLRLILTKLTVLGPHDLWLVHKTTDWDFDRSEQFAYHSQAWSSISHANYLQSLGPGPESMPLEGPSEARAASPTSSVGSSTTRSAKNGERLRLIAPSPSELQFHLSCPDAPEQLGNQKMEKRKKPR